MSGQRSIAQGFLAALGVVMLGMSLLIAPAKGQDMRLVELYAELQVAQPGLLPHMDEAASGWVLDRQHDYARHVRALENGAQHEVELALWLDGEAMPLLGVNERMVRAGGPISGRIRFYSRASGRWNLVTNRVLPALSSLCDLPPDDADGAVEGQGTFQPVALYVSPAGADMAAWCLVPSARAGKGTQLRWLAEAGGFVPGPAVYSAPPWQARTPQR